MQRLTASLAVVLFACLEMGVAVAGDRVPMPHATHGHGTPAPETSGARDAQASDDAAWLQDYAVAVLEPGADVHAARRAIQRAGGTVAVILPPRVLYGRIPAEVAGRAGIRTVTRDPSTLTALARTVAREAPAKAGDARATQAALAFGARALRGDLQATKPAADPTAPPEYRPDAFDRHDISEFDIAANLRAAGIDDTTVRRLQARASKSGGGTALAANSEFMTGTVAVSLFFVESDGSGTDPNQFNWTDNAEQNIYDEAVTGLAWWSSKATTQSNCWVTFVVTPHFATEDARCAQWREPVLHGYNDYAAAIATVMGNFGFTSGNHLSRVSAYNLAQRAAQDTDWAYCAFVAANPTGAKAFTDGYAAWAYLGGPYTALLQRSFSWPFRQVFAHESAHIFRACDEYYVEGYGGCTTCGGCADTGVANGNCESCNSTPASCMMRSNAWSLCDFTAGQLGWWRDPCVEEELAPPELDMVTPQELTQGSDATLILEGAIFSSGAVVACGAGITTRTVEFLDATRLRVGVFVDLDATPGTRDVGLTFPDGRTAQRQAALTVRRTPRHYVSAVGAHHAPFDSPANAATTLTAALAACSSGDTLFLAGGTYAPFSLVRDVIVSGGWSDDFQSRARDLFPSIVDADGAGSAVIIGGIGIRPVLDGLVLRGGGGELLSPSELGPVMAGGGILCMDASPLLRDCILEANVAGSAVIPGVGGGGFFWRSRPTLERCTVRANRAGAGGGLYFLDCDATLSDTEVRQNEVAGASAVGAGIVLRGGTFACRGGNVSANTGAIAGGGIYGLNADTTCEDLTIENHSVAGDGGGLHVAGMPLRLRRCNVSGNAAVGRGGGIFAFGDSLSLVSTRLAYNTSGVLGGAACLISGVATFEHLTCAGNSGGPVAGIFVENATALGRVRNCIFAFNAPGGFVQADGSPTLLDWNTYWDNGDYDLLTATPGPHDAWEDPRFADLAARDLHLGLHSPCIDAGETTGADPDGSRRDRGAYGGPLAMAGVPPRVAGLQARRTPEGVRLTWEPVIGADIENYAVHRGSDAGFEPLESTLVALVASPSTAFVDAAPTPGSWYIVSAVGMHGHAGGFAPAASATSPTDAAGALTALALHPVRPNPARRDAWIEFEVPHARGAILEVFDARGGRVRRFEAARATGRGRIHWDGRDDAGRLVAAGTYWLRLADGPDHRTTKLTWLR